MRLAHSKQQPWHRVLYGLGLRHVGSVNAQLLTEHYETVEALMAADENAIATIHGIGPEIAQSVFEWLQTPSNQILVQRLQAAGLQFFSYNHPAKPPSTVFRHDICDYRYSSDSQARLKPSN